MASPRHDALLVFMPSGKRGRFPLGTPILQAARNLGVDIDSVCGGRGICGRCQIEVSEGEFAKLGVTSKLDHLTPFGEVEKRYADRRGLKPGRRLSCSTLLQGDVVIDVPPDSQVHKQVVRKRAEMRAIQIDPVVRLHYVEVVEPNMHDPSGDLQRLLQALETQWDLKGLDCDLRAIQGLQKALRQGEWTVTVAVHQNQQITAIWPGFRDKAFGLAVDVGSTTIAGHLCDLASGEVVASAGVMNPQIRFGEDLMSRVSYVMMNPGGDVDMTRAVREAINGLAASVAAEVGRRGARHPGGHLRRQSDHASSVAGHRSDGAGRRAFCAGVRRRGEHLGVGDRSAHPSERARLSCCPASPAMWAPIPPGSSFRNRRRPATK